MSGNTVIIVGVVAFCIDSSAMIVANILITVMIGEINRKSDEQSLVFGHVRPTACTRSRGSR